MLLPHVANLGDDPALSPDQSPAPDAPVFLLHGVGGQRGARRSKRCAWRSTSSRTRTVHVLLTPLISHAEVDRPATTTEVIALVRFWAGMF